MLFSSHEISGCNFLCAFCILDFRGTAVQNLLNCVYMCIVCVYLSGCISLLEEIVSQMVHH